MGRRAHDRLVPRHETATHPLAICAADAAGNEPDDPDLIPLTVNEVRRLINTFIIGPIRGLAHRLRWSQWRRRHQARARRSHYTRRLNLELQP
ncbi:hypothetical protein Q2K19_25715 [Micromonospora soli]|uniref:hypothetical protein n=1 Tax=Micromonospora sp. NBRC 110009 TaxID=3061627 RepID=UPI002672A4F2|nr:hypothetical protein [Micromonospora sp. NBRC 110009]WKU02406.1 hypothetical protein Q2K19_25715 [Micromonospora sp. NBRC 110009]